MMVKNKVHSRAKISCKYSLCRQDNLLHINKNAFGRMHTARSLPYGGLCLGGSLSRGVSVQGSLSRAVSIQGGLCPGGLCLEGLCPGGSLAREISVQGGLCLKGLCPGVPLTETSSPPCEQNHRCL